MNTNSPPETKYYLVAFLTFTATNPEWQLNLSSVGTWQAGEGWKDGSAADLEASFKLLQGQGAKVLVSYQAT